MKLGIGIILLLLALNIPSKIDFGKTKAGKTWRTINDGVMGGLSEGDIELTTNSLKFNGTISLENNGGFSSFRCPYGKYNLSKYSKIKLRVRGENSKFGMVLELFEQWYLPNYKATFSVKDNEWTEIILPFEDFKQHVIGRKRNLSISKTQLSKIIRLGFITDDKAAKPFSLEIDYIEFL